MRILILGGNSNGVDAAQALANYPVIYSTLTEYGGDRVRGLGVETVCGELDEESLRFLIESRGVDVLVDATHPFAEEISRLAIAVSGDLKLPYLRYEPETALTPRLIQEELTKQFGRFYDPTDFLEDIHIIEVDSQKEAAELLKNLEGQILLTTGSKELETWEIIDKDRLKIRVLPTSGVLKKCEDLGYKPGQIIAEQGPFTFHQNLYQIQDNHINYLVTKSGGKYSGFIEKIGAAVATQTNIVIIRPPVIDYPDVIRSTPKLVERIKLLEGRAGRIMFQGTGSSVGKSLLNAALCRILYQDGFEVAPFKSQNMALNSYITADGLEMGRAQVTQAECAGKAPSVEMNPVLLKPSSDDGSQVIVNGVVWKTLKAQDYYVNKDLLLDEVLKSYEKLERENQVIVIEGAGSPAEINLRENDIVNMGFAEAVDAPVILVCDIDKGGVFASLYGTLMLLSDEERARVKGYIINKFRGDVELLKPGIDMMAEMIDVPCLGVMPYINLDIDDEDSVTDRLEVRGEGGFKIGVVRLKHFSNASDFTVFHSYEDIDIEYYMSARALEEADLDVLIIPGSKNTIDDMRLLEESGIADVIKKKAETIPVVGICGGFQMMGRVIEDPLSVESNLGKIEGLGLLDIATVLNDEKTTTQIAGTVDGLPLKGYEIHMGETFGEAEPFCRLEDGRYDGARAGKHFGTYLHGLFDNDAFREKFLRETGYTGKGRDDYLAYKESQYDLLAEAAREHLDIERIKRIIDES